MPFRTLLRVTQYSTMSSSIPCRVYLFWGKGILVILMAQPVSTSCVESPVNVWVLPHILISANRSTFTHVRLVSPISLIIFVSEFGSPIQLHSQIEDDRHNGFLNQSTKPLTGIEQSHSQILDHCQKRFLMADPTWI